jgi:hypothetical protein
VAACAGSSPRFGCCFFWGVRFDSRGAAYSASRRFRGFTRGHHLCWRCASVLDRGPGCLVLARTADSVDLVLGH